MRPEVKLIIDALNAVIDETADFNCYLDKIEFLEAENRVLVSTPVEQDVKASRNNKYILRDNFFKKFLGVPVENIEGKYAFLIPLDELSRLKIITEKMKALQNPPVQKNNSNPDKESRRSPVHNLKKLLERIKPSEEVLSKLGPEIHYIHFSSSPDVIPKGRHFIPQAIDKKIKDTTLAVLAALDARQGLDHTLFINFTGHEAPVANALYMHGIDCIWQLSIVSDETSQIRIMDQLQDSLPRDELLLHSPQLHDSSLGLILEPNHGFTEIEEEKLPAWDRLKEFGIQQVVLLTEKNFNQGKCIYPLEEHYFESERKFYSWIQSVPQSFNLWVIGVGHFKEKTEEDCQTIEEAFKIHTPPSPVTYKLPTHYSLFKTSQISGTYTSPLSLNGTIKVNTKEEDENESTLGLD